MNIIYQILFEFEIRLPAKFGRYGGPIIFPSLFHIGLCPTKHN